MDNKPLGTHASRILSFFPVLLGSSSASIAAVENIRGPQVSWGVSVGSSLQHRASFRHWGGLFPNDQRMQTVLGRVAKWTVHSDLT